MKEVALAIFSALKIPARALFAMVLLICTVALWNPFDLVPTLGLMAIVDQYRAYIGVAFLVSAAFFVVSGLAFFGDLIFTRIQTAIFLRYSKEKLHDLTHSQREILRGYILGKTKTQYLDPRDGVVVGLVQANVIYMASNIGRLDGMAYNIQPWAWKYLQENWQMLLTEEEEQVMRQELAAKQDALRRSEL